MHRELVEDLIEWIELHLHSPLTIEMVSLKSGYSNWHLQRLFKKMTCLTLGSYIIKRKLTNSAIALRISKSNICDIAVNNGYDSQQTFTRSFKNYFGIAPSTYRSNVYWDFSRLTPKFLFDNDSQLNYRHIKSKSLKGYINDINLEYSHDLTEVVKKKSKIESEIRKKHNNSSKETYIVRYIPNVLTDENKYVIREFISVCLDDHLNDMNVTRKMHDLRISDNVYVEFVKTAESDNYGDFIKDVYARLIPSLNIIRGIGYDIEVHKRTGKDGSLNEYRYLIPVSLKDPSSVFTKKL